uniref:Uncharacterized protein n=1 Tax=Amphimedon queenslandica TaxID=400682 RepID=A0A1X7SM00_AMPQE
MKKRRQRNSVYYKKNATQLKRNIRAGYALKLTEPKLEIKQKYISLIRPKLAKNVGIQKQLKVAFSVDKSLPFSVTQSGINLIASRRLVNLILNIHQALSEGDVDALIKIATGSDPNNEKSDVAQLFSSRCDESDSDINLRDPYLEAKLLQENVNLIAEFQKEISDQNGHVCCSCRRLMRRSNLAKVFDKDRESDVWKELEAFLTDYDPDFDNKQLLMCRHCKPIIQNNRIPARCALNGLQSEPLPDELKHL